MTSCQHVIVRTFPQRSVFMTKSTLVLITTLLLPGVAHGQKTPGAAPGSTVRVWSTTTPGQMSEGRLVTWTADTVAVSPVWEPKNWQGGQLIFPATSLIRMDVERVRTSTEGLNRGFKKGLVFGLFAGAAAYLLLKDLEKDNAIPLAAGAAAAGLAIYSGYGYLAPGSTWEQVHPRPRPMFEEVRP
jgi:hypothetical protein